MDFKTNLLQVTVRFVVTLFLTFSFLSPAKATFIFEIHSQNFSDNLPIYRFANHLNSRYQSGKLTFTHNELLIGYAWSNYSIAMVERYDYTLHFNPDSLKLAYLSENDLPVEENHLYQVDVDISHTKSKGLRFGLNLPTFYDIKTEIFTSILRGNYVLDGTATGTITTGINNSYQGDVFVDYHYSEDLLLNRKVNAPHSWGIAMDLKLSGKINRVQWQYQVKDAFTRWFWKSAPYTLANISSDTVNFDENGFIDTRPVAEGILTKHFYRQRLPARHALKAEVSLNHAFGVQSRVRYTDQNYFTEVGFSYLFANQIKIIMLSDIEHSAWCTEVQHKNITLSVQLDNKEWKEASTMRLYLLVNY